MRKNAAKAKGKREVGRPKGKGNDDSSVQRLEMIDAATALLAEAGTANVTIAKVARRAGYTPAAVHYHFKNREALLDAVVQSTILPLIDFIWSALDESTDDPVTTALEVARRVFSIGCENPWLPSVWLTEIVGKSGILQKRLLAHVPKNKLGQFVSLLTHGQKTGVINPSIAPNLVLLNILGMTMLSLAARPLWNLFERDGEAVTEEMVLRHVESLLRGGLTAAPAKRKRSRP